MFGTLIGFLVRSYSQDDIIVQIKSSYKLYFAGVAPTKFDINFNLINGGTIDIGDVATLELGIENDNHIFLVYTWSDSSSEGAISLDIPEGFRYVLANLFYGNYD
jgi:hypothetical protein